MIREFRGVAVHRNGIIPRAANCGAVEDSCCLVAWVEAVALLLILEQMVSSFVMIDIGPVTSYSANIADADAL